MNRILRLVGVVGIVLVGVSGASLAGEGYLTPTDISEIKNLIAKPVKGDAADLLDHRYYAITRAILQTSRGKQAAEDDLYDVDDFVPTFSAAYGVRLNRQQQPKLFALLDSLLSGDAQSPYGIVNDLKKLFGRQRPIFEFGAKAETCIKPVDLAGFLYTDTVTYPLDEFGSSPSGHAFRGMLTALVLAEIHPEHAAELINRGIEFGESRVICGFHWESDTQISRILALAAIERMRANDNFKKIIDAIRSDPPAPYVECKCNATPAPAPKKGMQ